MLCKFYLNSRRMNTELSVCRTIVQCGDFDSTTQNYVKSHNLIENSMAIIETQAGDGFAFVPTNVNNFCRYLYQLEVVAESREYFSHLIELLDF